jgi:uncharacterized hydrophobic protein (TIGR00271 family)
MRLSPNAARGPASTRGDGQNRGMITVRVTCPHALTESVIDVMRGAPNTSALVVMRDAALSPQGDVVEVDVPREGANLIVNALVDLGVPEEGTIKVLEIPTWISDTGLRAAKAAPGEGADAVVWSEVVERAYDDSALTFTYLAFMILATMLAAIAVAADSTILVIGAMVLGPEFVPIAALGLAMVRKRPSLLRRALRTLVIGFAVSIVVVAGFSLIARWAGLITAADIDTSGRVGTSFIYSPSIWSFVIAVIAGAAGVLALTSSKAGGLAGVFISVTTIPAAGNIAIASVFGLWQEVWGSAVTLTINVVGMALAGWATLAIQQTVWDRVKSRRGRRPSAAPRSS